MSMKLFVGVSRKVGLPDYGSVDASCGLELEVESGLLERDLEAFHARVRDAYVAAHQAVHDELARLHAPLEGQAEGPARASAGRSTSNGHGKDGPGDHSSQYQAAPPRGRKPATASQVRAIRAIARRRDAELGGLLRREFDAGRPEDLSLRQASRLIDLLKDAEEA
jgi:hypothetical protein